RALSHFFMMQREGLTDALTLLMQAIERDPQFAPALALMAEIHIYENANGWVEDAAKTAHEAIELAHQALRFGSDDPETFSCAAYALGLFGEDIDAAIALIDRFLAASYAHMGRLPEAHEVIGKLRNVTPRVLGLDVPFVPYRKSEHRDLLLAGLRLAAGET